MDHAEEDAEALEELWDRPDLAAALLHHYRTGTPLPHSLRDTIRAYVDGSEYDVSDSDSYSDDDDVSSPGPCRSVIDLTRPLNWRPIPHGTVIDLT